MGHLLGIIGRGLVLTALFFAWSLTHIQGFLEFAHLIFCFVCWALFHSPKT